MQNDSPGLVPDGDPGNKYAVPELIEYGPVEEITAQTTVIIEP